MAIISKRYPRSREELNLIKWRAVYEQMQQSQLSNNFLEISRRKIRLNKLSQRIKSVMDIEKKKMKKRKHKNGKNAVITVNEMRRNYLYYQKGGNNYEMTLRKEAIKYGRLKGNEYSKNNRTILQRVVRRLSNHEMKKSNRQAIRKSNVTEMNSFKFRSHYGNMVSTQNFVKSQLKGIKSTPQKSNRLRASQYVPPFVSRTNSTDFIKDSTKPEKAKDYGYYYTIKNRLQLKDHFGQYDEEYHKLLVECIDFEKTHSDVIGFLENKFGYTPHKTENFFITKKDKYSGNNVMRSKLPRIDYFTANDTSRPMSKTENTVNKKIYSQNTYDPVNDKDNIEVMPTSEIFVSFTKVSTFSKTIACNTNTNSPQSFNLKYESKKQSKQDFGSEKVLKTLRYNNHKDPLVTYNKFSQSSSFAFSSKNGYYNDTCKDVSSNIDLINQNPHSNTVLQSEQQRNYDDDHHESRKIFKDSNDISKSLHTIYRTVGFEDEFQKILELSKNNENYHDCIISIMKKCKMFEFQPNDYAKVFFDLYLIFTMLMLRKSLHETDQAKLHYMSNIFKEEAIRQAKILSKSLENFLF